MPLTLPIELHEGHPYLTIDGRRWVLDTGSPVSFGESSCHPLDASLPFVRKHANVDAVIVSGLLGVQVAGVIGCDFLNRHDHHIDLPSGIFHTGDSQIPFAHDIALSFPDPLRGLPTIRAKIGEEEGEFIFDTGAQLSYFVGQAPAGHVPGEIFWDFWPGLGTFQTRTYSAKVTIASHATTLRFGVPPDRLHQFLIGHRLLGVIGIDLIAQHACSYAPKNRLMKISRNNLTP